MGFGSEMEGCGKVIKYSFFLSNFIIFIGGITVLGIGTWTLVDKTFINELLGTNLFIGAVYILIFTGALVSIISLFGCIGAGKEIKCMLLTYFIVLLILFVIMLVGGILGYIFREKVKTTMQQEMYSTLRLYNEKRIITKAWDDTQENLHCCGVHGFQDWRGNTPESCCKLINGKKLPCRNIQTSFNTYTDGCLDVATVFVQKHAEIIGGAGIAVSILLLFGLIFACVLFKMIE